ncbi:9813_t:CDS:2, partial [Racocetra fulgida]
LDGQIRSNGTRQQQQYSSSIPMSLTARNEGLGVNGFLYNSGVRERDEHLSDDES